MDITSIHSTTAANVNHARTEQSDEVRAARKDAARTAEARDADAVEVRGSKGEDAELTAARAAMRQIDTLDDARRAEIQARLESGFYNQPETIAQVSEAMAKALTPKQGS